MITSAYWYYSLLSFSPRVCLIPGCSTHPYSMLCKCLYNSADQVFYMVCSAGCLYSMRSRGSASKKKKRWFCGLTTADWRWSDELHIISNGNIQMTLSKLVRNVCLKLGLKPLLCPKQWSQCLFSAIDSENFSATFQQCWLWPQLHYKIIIFMYVKLILMHLTTTTVFTGFMVITLKRWKLDHSYLLP